MKIFYFFVPFFLLLSCSKESTERRDIKAGQKFNMNINSYDETLSFSSISHNYDLNSDRKDDFAILTETWGSPGLGHHNKLSIVALHDNAELAGYYTVDTGKVVIDDYLAYSESGIFHVTTYYNYCSCILGSYDSIVFIVPSFKLNYYYDDDLITGKEEFISDTLIIGDDEYEYGGWQTGTSGDTTFIRRSVFYNDCNKFPQGVVTYIGVRLNKKRLGWIKLIISDLGSITVLETAIQRM